MRIDLWAWWSRLLCLVVGHDRELVEYEDGETVAYCRRWTCRGRYWVVAVRHG